MSGAQAVLVSVDGPVATITFNRPEKLNAADLAQCHALEAAVAAVGAEPGVRVVLLRGAGRSFGSGIDRDMLADGMPPDFVPSHERSYAALEDMDKLVVGVLHGHCLGAGLLAALACDLRICSTDAVLGLTAARFGLFPAMGTFRLPRLIGLGPARRLILSGETVDPAEAYRLGLVDHLVPAERFADGVDELVAHYAALSPVRVVAIKRLTAARSTHRATPSSPRPAAARGVPRGTRRRDGERRVAGAGRALTDPLAPGTGSRTQVLPGCETPSLRAGAAPSGQRTPAGPVRSPAYATASTSASQDASTTLPCTPTVVHEPLAVGRLDEHPGDGVRAARLPRALRGEQADLEVRQLDVREPRPRRRERRAQGGVEGVDRAVALARRDDPLAVDDELDRRLGDDLAAAVLDQHPVRLEREREHGPVVGRPSAERMSSSSEASAASNDQPCASRSLTVRDHRRHGVGTAGQVQAELGTLELDAGPAGHLRDQHPLPVADVHGVHVVVQLRVDLDRTRVQARLVGER